MNKYLQYDSIDFAQEQSFIRWVRRSNAEDIAYWQKWTEQHPEKKDDIEKAFVLVNQIVFKESKIEKGAEEKLWSRIQDGISTDISTTNSTKNNIPQKKSTGKMIRLATLAAVAAVAIFFLMVNTNSDFDTTVQTQIAETIAITLPDGSKVQLNADSKLSYDSESWNTSRKIALEGEAFFEVEKGSKFVVTSDNGEVAVLGTSFNIYARAKGYNVYCKTGKVAVTIGKNTTFLTPNQAVTMVGNKHKIEKDVQINNNRSLWKEGVYTYDNTPLEIVIKELERQLDLTISIPNKFKKIKYTGSFTTSDKITALSEVLWPLGLKYTQDGQRVIVTE